MRTIVIASTALLLSQTALAEQPEANPRTEVGAPNGESSAPSDRGPETVFRGKGSSRHDAWYIAPSIGVTTADGDAALTLGGRAAWLVDGRFGIGLAGTAFTNDVSENASRNTIDGGYGGLLLQYVIRPDDTVHGFIDTTIGGGAVCVGADARDDDGCSREYGFFMVEPTANVELNLAEHIRIAVGGGYRFASAESESTLSGGDLGGFVFRSSVLFGEF